MPGTTTSGAEVTHISKHGFWLLVADEELLVPFAQFPWFRQSTIAQLTLEFTVLAGLMEHQQKSDTPVRHCLTAQPDDQPQDK